MTRLHSNNQAPLSPKGLPEGFTLPGGYVIEAPLGSGGFGAVYAGRDTQLERAVAVKVLRRSLDERALKRFRDEGRLLAKLQHPNIIQVYASGLLDDQRAYLIMERFGTGSISDHWPRGERPPLEVSLSIIQQLLKALKAAHDAGVIHRDIKEPNLLYDARSGLVKLCDFGIARSLTPLVNQAETTEEGIIVGSLPYLAPERLRGSHGDARSDLYSVGVLLYRLLTGRRPFEEQSGERLPPHVLITRTLTEAPQLPSGLPDRWARLCLALLEKNPQHRPESAARALSWLEDNLELSATESASISSPYLTLPAEPSLTTKTSGAWPKRLTLGLTLGLALITLYILLSPLERPAARRVLKLGPQLRPQVDSVDNTGHAHGQGPSTQTDKLSPPSRAPALSSESTALSSPVSTPSATLKPAPSAPRSAGAARDKTRTSRSRPRSSRKKHRPRGSQRPRPAPTSRGASPFVYPTKSP